MLIRYLVVIFILFFLINPCPSFSWQGEVISIYDGDSLQIRNIKGEIVKIRVYGVDCPEIGQPYGDEARLMTGKSIARQDRGCRNRAKKQKLWPRGIRSFTDG